MSLGNGLWPPKHTDDHQDAAFDGARLAPLRGRSRLFTRNAVGVSLLANPLGGDDSLPGLHFLGAVVLSGGYGGLGPALLTTVVGTGSGLLLRDSAP